MSSRKFLLVAFGALMSAPLLAQSGGGTMVGAAAPLRTPRRSPLDTMRAMMQRRNPTIDEVIAWSADVAKKFAEMHAINEKARRENQAADEARQVELQRAVRDIITDAMQTQRVLAEACNLIRPHEGESEGVLGFQIEKATTFQNTTPVVREERFVRRPEIVFVEPNTPAAKAGVREGDVWVGISGRELVNTYVRDLNDVLKPDNRVDLKLLRDGRSINVEVVARKRREYPEEACNTGQIEIRRGEDDLPKVQLFGGSFPSGRTEFFTMKISKSMAAGALFTELTKDQREAFPKIAPNEGVLVEAVMAGSPAEAAGLKPFDVITRANNEIISSPMDLMKVIQGSMLPVSLWVIKGDNQRKVILPVGR